MAKVPLTYNGKDIGTAEVDLLAMSIKAEITDPEALQKLRDNELPIAYSIMHDVVELKGTP